MFETTEENVPVAITLDQMRAEVNRELGMRRVVYPRWINQGKKNPQEAANQIERLEAVLEVLEEVRLAREFATAFQVGMTNAGVIEAWKQWQDNRTAPLTLGQRVA